jgi:hypothetical protein
MTPEQKIKLVIAETFFYYSQRPIEEVGLKVYTKDLLDLDADKVVQAFEDWRRNPGNRRFPLPADIRGILSPTVSVEGQAREAAAKVVGGPARFGSYRHEDARAWIGELGWEAMSSMYGGWANFCGELQTRQIPQVQAQIRDLCMAILERQSKRPSAPAISHQPADRPRLEDRSEQRKPPQREFKSIGDLLQTMPLDVRKGPKK